MFKTKYIKISTEGKTLTAIKKGVCLYGKTFSNRYRIEWVPILGLGGFAVPIYLGKTKPIFKDLWVLSILFFLPSLVLTVLLPIIYFLMNYFDGMMNYIRDGVWQTNVRFFNNLNIILLLLFLILYLTK